ncbi:MAG: pantetheine-phosphate adenylyltransferase [Bacteroidetes bacterium]|jgi:pantetheine-phosphate adenylyltransferase|nr:pantetheine-phosphate adenylyltransferase [Bacteroidota bacterium]
MKIAIYPGTFDPVTNGHLDILDRAVKLFDKVIISVARNSTKNPIFTEDERIALLKAAAKKYKNVRVESFTGLLVEYARSKKATAIVRGLRVISDFEYEFQMALANRRLHEDVETVFLMPNEKYTYLSSSIVREVARLNGNVRDFVPPIVRRALKKKLRAGGSSTNA